MSSTNSIVKGGTDERQLLECLKGLADHAERGWALQLHLSKLGAQSRCRNLMYALDMFRTLVHQFSGRVFCLKSGDVACVLRDSRIAEVRAGLKKIQLLFHDDPLFQLEQDPNARLYDIYNLNDSYEAFLATAAALADGMPPPLRIVGQQPTPAPAPIDAPADGVDLRRYAAKVEFIEKMDLVPFLRTQRVARLSPGQAPVSLFEELHVSIPDLDHAFSSGPRLTADRSLFQYLTHVLDRRMLRLLDPANARAGDADEARPRLLARGKFSINLNVASVLTPEFRAFDAGLADAVRETVVLEFQRADVFADVGGFLYARGLARKRGYRVCLDGLSHLSLPLMNLTDLGLDLLKLFWTADMRESRESVGRAIERIGRDRVILCRCDSAQAIEFGRSVGVSVFQGKQVDAMLGSARPLGAAPATERTAAPVAGAGSLT